LEGFVAGVQRFFERGFVLFQGVVDRCGNKMKGYSKFVQINVLGVVLTTNDDF
jgi:hypothetical protein